MALHPRCTGVLLLLVAASGCDCETQLASTPAIFQMKPRSLDFGTVCLNDTADMQIVLSNLGNADLAIKGVTLTPGAFQILGWVPPGATDPQAAQPAGIAAGTDVVLHVGFTPTQEGADYAASLVVDTDGADSPGNPPKASATLVGRGFRADPGVNPQSLRQYFRATCSDNGASTTGAFSECFFLGFGKVLAGTSADRTVRLENAGCAIVNVNEAIRYLDPNAPPGEDPKETDYFSLPAEKPPLLLHGGEHRDVAVRFTAPGDSDAVPLVRLKFTSDDPGSHQRTGGTPGIWDLSLQAEPVLPALLVYPDRMTFFEATAGVPLTKTFTVANTGSADLRIASVTLVPDGGTQDYAIVLPNNETTFTLGAAGSGTEQRVVQVVFTSHGGTASAKVVVQGDTESRQVALVGGTQPVLEVEWIDGATPRPPPVDFGQTATGATDVTRTVTMKNTGQAPLTITSVSIADDAGGSFTAGAFVPGSLPPADSRQIVVTFKDNIHLTNDSAKLRIASNDAVDASSGGERFVQLLSANTANLNPVPRIDACGGIDPSTGACQPAGPQVGVPLWFDGRGSSDPEGDTIAYRWTLQVPSASKARLVGPTGQAPTPQDAYAQVVSDAGAYPDVASGVGAGNIYVVRLKVTDSFGNWAEIQRTIPVAGH